MRPSHHLRAMQTSPAVPDSIVGASAFALSSIPFWLGGSGGSASSLDLNGLEMLETAQADRRSGTSSKLAARQYGMSQRAQERLNSVPVLSLTRRASPPDMPRGKTREGLNEVVAAGFPKIGCQTIPSPQARQGPTWAPFRPLNIDSGTNDDWHVPRVQAASWPPPADHLSRGAARLLRRRRSRHPDRRARARQIRRARLCAP